MWLAFLPSIIFGINYKTTNYSFSCGAISKSLRNVHLLNEHFLKIKCILSTAYLGGILATTNFFLNIRALDILFMFLIVWYYCTLTIRESILIVNGSRIKVRFYNKRTLSFISDPPCKDCFVRFITDAVPFETFIR